MFRRGPMMLTYSDLITLPTFEERLEYLRTVKLPSEVTFSELRYLNQKFYTSRVWKLARRHVISRDFGYDLGIPGRIIMGKAMVHHMNPITPEDLLVHQDEIVDPEFLISVSHDTHQAIHYGSPVRKFVTADRTPGDTRLW